jgi:hypothetical protein
MQTLSGQSVPSWNSDTYPQHQLLLHLDHGLRRGLKTVLGHFHILKLELMQHVIPSITQVGSLLQWSADTTEHTHIEVVKDPASMMNNQDYNGQICHVLDCDEKRRLFETAILLRMSQTTAEVGGEEDNGSDHENDRDGTSNENILEDLWTTKHKTTDFFKVAARTASTPTDASSSPPCTIVAGSVAIHLNIEPKLRHESIDEVARRFDLPDLHAALDDYMNHEGKSYPLNRFHTFGTRRSSSDVNLPFTKLQV